MILFFITSITEYVVLLMKLSYLGFQVPTCACATNGRRRIRGSLNILRKILWKNVLNIRKDIVGGRLSQIVVERCPFSGSSSLRAKKETTDAKKSQLCKFDVSRGWVGDWWTPWLVVKEIGT